MNIQVAPVPVSKFSGRSSLDTFDDISRFNRQGLFVGGCPKSGTTLLLTLLDSHPELVVLPAETHFFDEGKKYREMDNFRDKARHLAGRPELRMLDQVAFESGRLPGGVGGEPVKFDHARFAKLAEQFATRPWVNDSMLLSETIRAFAVTAGYDWRGCTRWVEKTTSNVSSADDLFRLFPDAKLIQIVRDPRAVFASRRRIHIKHYGSYTKAHRLVREWNESARLIPGLRGRGGQFLLISYEDLVRDSRAVLEKVCEFAGINFHPVVLEPTLAGERWTGNSAFYTAFSGIDAHPVDQWKNELCDDEIWWVDLHCREGMKMTGYQPRTDAGFSFRRWAKRLPGESLGGYLRARKSSLLQLAGLLKDCRYDAQPRRSHPKMPAEQQSAPSVV